MKKKSPVSTATGLKKKTLREISFDEPYLPPLREFHKRQVRDYLGKFLFKFVNHAQAENSAANEEERHELIFAQKEIEDALSELEMILDRVSNLIWRERGYEHILTLLRMSFKIGSNGSVSDVSQKFAKRKQAEAARAGKKKYSKLDALSRAIKEISSEQKLQLKAGDKFADSIRDQVCYKLSIERLASWPSLRTISRQIEKILKESDQANPET